MRRADHKSATCAAETEGNERAFVFGYEILTLGSFEGFGIGIRKLGVSAFGESPSYFIDGMEGGF